MVMLVWFTIWINFVKSGHNTHLTFIGKNEEMENKVQKVLHAVITIFINIRCVVFTAVITSNLLWWYP